MADKFLEIRYPILASVPCSRVRPDQYDDANALHEVGASFHEQQNRAGRLIVTGHSLGGYLTQAICGRYGAWGCTFNAPGARSLFAGVLFGVGSSFSDENLTTAEAQVLNFTLKGDPVSSRAFGKRIEKKIHLISSSFHSQTTMKAAVEASRYGEMDLDDGLAAAQSARGGSMIPIVALR